MTTKEQIDELNAGHDWINLPEVTPQELLDAARLGVDSIYGSDVESTEEKLGGLLFRVTAQLYRNIKALESAERERDELAAALEQAIDLCCIAWHPSTDKVVNGMDMAMPESLTAEDTRLYGCDDHPQLAAYLRRKQAPESVQGSGEPIGDVNEMVGEVKL